MLRTETMTRYLLLACLALRQDTAMATTLTTPANVFSSTNSNTELPSAQGTQTVASVSQPTSIDTSESTETLTPAVSDEGPVKSPSEPATSPPDSSERFGRQISNCLHERERLYLRIDTRTQSFHFLSSKWNIATSLLNTSLNCIMTLTCPEGKVLRMRLQSRGSSGSCSQENQVTVGDDVRNVTARHCRRSDSVITSLKRTVKVVLHVGQVKAAFNVTLHVEVMEQSLERGNITTNMGFIQTPGFTEGVLYPPSMDCWTSIAAPSGHVTLLSFLFLLIHTSHTSGPRMCDLAVADVLQLYKGGQRRQHLTWTTCHVNVPLPEVHHDPVMWIRFVSNEQASDNGFRLLYSFHPPSRAPSRVSGGLWNCSVPEWSKFQAHFNCNLLIECEAGQDELPCFYSGFCGQGYITLHDRCYIYVQMPLLEKLSWLESNQQCQKRGGYLASLNYPQEWRNVVRVLNHRTSRGRVFLGLQDNPPVKARLYTHTSIWADGTIAYYTKSYRFVGAYCGLIHFWGPGDRIDMHTQCLQKINSIAYVCELESLSRKLLASLTPDSQRNDLDIVVRLPTNETFPVPLIECPDGHRTHEFLACDVESACWWQRGVGGSEHEAEEGVPSVTSCPAPMTSLPVMFVCGSGVQRVPYSLVCDHLQHCDDDTDETFCVFPPCSPAKPYKCGTSQQCVAQSALCDGQGDCPQGQDEALCKYDLRENLFPPPPPALVLFTPVTTAGKHSPFSFTPLPFDLQEGRSRDVCPETHFQCPPDGYCLPVFVRCNGILDCPGREDEAHCHAYACQGLYRCRQSTTCLHPDHVCDGLYQCPQKDDELFCNLTCPHNCTCHALAFRCPQSFPAPSFPDVRYLDASGSGMTPGDLTFNTMLIYLSLRQCGLRHFHNVSLPNVRSVDLHLNDIRIIHVDDLKDVVNLQHLVLSRNPIRSLFSPVLGSVSFPALLTLDVSRVHIHDINMHTFSIFPNLQSLNFSQCGITRVSGVGFHINSLTVLDFTGCPMIQIPRSLLQGLQHLKTVRADTFKLCCPVMLPDNFNNAQCVAPHDDVSSCQALLRSDVYRLFLSLFSILALVGNVGCFLLRSCFIKSSKSGFGVLVTHLSIADFLMGVYLGVIGVADRIYLGSYLWKAETWRHGVACQAAGFLSLLSSEVSAVIICLITLDRFLVLTFPFGSAHFTHRSAQVMCLMLWGVMTTVAAVPLLPVTSHWRLYSQTGICMPLPISSHHNPGRHYAFAIIIVFNFVLFLLIAMGQVFIYATIRANSMKVNQSSKKTNDVQIARRLIMVAVSDFICWFPIGLLGLLAAQGHPIPSQVNVSMAIFVLPLNSALNPFLYTFNVIVQNRRRRLDGKLLKDMMANIMEQESNFTLN